MNGQSKNWELALAGPEDSAGMQKVFDDGDFKGGISVKFSRAPDPYMSFLKDGEQIIMPIAKDTSSGEIFGVGGCVIRQGYVNGSLRNTGYLTGMKLLRSHQKQFNCIIPAYKLIGEQTEKYAPFYYTTILNSNEAAIKLLEKRRKNMPRYNYLGEYTAYCFGTGGRATGNGYTFSHGHTDSLAAFYREYLPEYNLSPKDEWLYGLKSDDFYYLQSRSGKVLAACALWNQQSYKRYIISGYSGIYKLLSRLPTGWMGYPKMPKAGMSANYASIAAFVVPEENHGIAEMFVRLVLSEAKGYEFVMLGMFESHPLVDIVRRMRHIPYKSRLYAVDYTSGATGVCNLDGRPVMLEVGLL